MPESEKENESTETQGSPLTPEQVRLVATAFHEAGHAVMAVSLGRPIQKVTIAPAQLKTGRSLGVCRIQKGRTKPTKDWIEDEAMILLAGMVAESHFTGQYCEQGAATDLRAVRNLLSDRAGTERKLEKLERRMLNKTEHLLQEDAHALAVTEVAKQLLEKETVSGRSVVHHFNMARQNSPTIKPGNHSQVQNNYGFARMNTDIVLVLQAALSSVNIREDLWLITSKGTQLLGSDLKALNARSRPCL